ncbi:MAG: glycosyltransferase family 39 protein [bacterium]|nr:glycosyltransferase family 39 protein [bacterium]
MYRERIALILVTALAAGLRFSGITHQGLWGDEAFSVYDARGVDMHFMTASLVDATHRRFVNPRPSLRAIVRACVRNEGTPPAYFLALAAWMKAFGGSDLAVRSLSAVLGVLAVPLFYLLGRRLFGDPVPALLAALFLAVSPLNIYFSQEARAYMMANCAAVAASWLLLRALDAERGAGPWAAYAAAALLVCYSFYFAALVLAAHALYVLVFARARLRPFALSMAAAAGLCLPWLALAFGKQLAVSSGYAPPGPAEAGAFIRATLAGLRYIADSLVLGPMYSREIVGDGVRRAVGGGLAALLAAGSVRLVRRGKGRAVAFALLLLLVPLGVIAAFGALRWTLWYMKPRYHMWEASGVLLLAAGAVWALRGAWARALLAAAVCAVSLAAAPFPFYPGVFDNDHSKPDFRAAAAVIAAGERRGDLVLVNIAGHMIPLNIYYRGGLRQVGIAECDRYDLAETLRRYTAGRERVWLLVGDDTRGHGDREIEAFLEGHFPEREARRFRKLALALYARGGTVNGPGR